MLPPCINTTASSLFCFALPASSVKTEPSPPVLPAILTTFCTHPQEFHYFLPMLFAWLTFHSGVNGIVKQCLCTTPCILPQFNCLYLLITYLPTFICSLHCPLPSPSCLHLNIVWHEEEALFLLYLPYMHCPTLVPCAGRTLCSLRVDLPALGHGLA